MNSCNALIILEEYCILRKLDSLDQHMNESMLNSRTFSFYSCFLSCRNIPVFAVVSVFSLLSLLLSLSVSAEFDHSSWDGLLKKHVVVLEGGQATQVDYEGMLQDRNNLAAYLDSTANVARHEFDTWSESAQLAFLINTYNAWTVELILTEYPGLRSIRQIGFLPFSAWRRKIVRLFEENYSLDEIEHGMIRGWGIYNEPRIHFAVNCAAIGCPALRAEAYESESLEQQLEDNTKLFLSDRSRNYFENDHLYISSIFDWYEEDFQQGWQEVNSVSEFLSGYTEELGLDANAIHLLQQGRLRIRHLRYDWDLNKLQ